MSAKRQPGVTDEEARRAARIVALKVLAGGLTLLGDAMQSRCIAAARAVLEAERAGRIRPKKAKVARGN